MIKNLKENIIRLCKEKDYSYRRLERDAGLHINFIGNLLSNEDKIPKIDSIIKLADTLEVSLDALVGREGNCTIVQNNNFIADNLELLKEVLSYHIENLKILNKQITINILLKSIREIYKFSIENNNGKLDQKFAKWYIENNFKS